MAEELRPLPILWQKRGFDVVVSLCILLCTLPLFAIFILLICTEHLVRGRPLDPVFYSEERISRGVRFRLYKFNLFDQRVVNAYRKENRFIHTKELEHGGHMIFIGKLLKQIYLDELPQLYNVLRREMSLVGPRPLNPEVFAQLAVGGTPPQALILGGMTGNFQSFKDTKGMSAHTLESDYLRRYAEGRGWRIVLTDIRIIIRTVKVLLRAKGV